MTSFWGGDVREVSNRGLTWNLSPLLHITITYFYPSLFLPFLMFFRNFFVLRFFNWSRTKKYEITYEIRPEEMFFWLLNISRLIRRLIRLLFFNYFHPPFRRTFRRDCRFAHEVPGIQSRSMHLKSAHRQTVGGRWGNIRTCVLIKSSLSVGWRTLKWVRVRASSVDRSFEQFIYSALSVHLKWPCDVVSLNPAG